jgi:hypothetical protein
MHCCCAWSRSDSGFYLEQHHDLPWILFFEWDGMQIAHFLLQYVCAYLDEKEAVMNMQARYYIIPDETWAGVIIFDSLTGAIQHPVCWQDLVAYYNYLVGQGRIDEAQKLLADSMAGNKPISKMFEFMSRASSADKCFG